MDQKRTYKGKYLRIALR